VNDIIEPCVGCCVFVHARIVANSGFLTQVNDLWMVNDEYSMNLACKPNEMVGVKVAWYWHELKSRNYVLREMDWYGTTGKEMKKVNYQAMACDVYV